MYVECYDITEGEAKEFLEEILEITTLMINNLSHTETKLLGEVISNEK